ncbi:hypothetical protein [Streptomyces sp. NPDC050738]|uniref:uridine kinase family protein n=1 Tax=Streptomyces sp. NPDC050738 TaxID=3154744 RepID=UPI003412FE06
MEDLARLAGSLSALPASCGPVRLIGIDGHAGSGKSTFAENLGEALGGAPVLHLDDVATHQDLFAWTDRLLETVIGPLARGAAARYAPYDWTLRGFGPERELRPAPVVLIEGVGAGRRAVRPFLAALLWMDLVAEESWARGRRRDGPAQAEFWDGWTAAEVRHFSEDPSKRFADLLVRQRRTGYEWLQRPSVTA